MTTSGSPRALVDTNVLIYATDRNAAQYAPSRALLLGAKTTGLELFVTTQNVLEYVSVVTSPRRVAVPMTTSQAWTEVANIRQLCGVLPAPADLIDRVVALVPTVNPKGPELFDLAIAIVALAAGITDIYSYDTAIFGRVPGIRVKAPS